MPEGQGWKQGTLKSRNPISRKDSGASEIKETHKEEV